MIRSKGEAGTGNIVEAVRHMREITDGHQAASRRCGPSSSPARPRSTRRRSTSSRRSPARGWLPGAALLRRRHRDPRGRRADDAARRRGQLRRLGHLQERGPRAPRARDRRGDHPLRGRRARRQGLDGAGRRDARPRDRGARRRRRPAAGPRQLDRCGSASSRSRATSRPTGAMLDVARRRGVRGAHARAARGARRPGHPRRRVDHDQQGHGARRARRRRSRARRRRAARSSAAAPG